MRLRNPLCRTWKSKAPLETDRPFSCLASLVLEFLTQNRAEKEMLFDGLFLWLSSVVGIRINYGQPTSEPIVEEGDPRARKGSEVDNREYPYLIPES